MSLTFQHIDVADENGTDFTGVLVRCDECTHELECPADKGVREAAIIGMDWLNRYCPYYRKPCHTDSELNDL